MPEPESKTTFIALTGANMSDAVRAGQFIIMFIVRELFRKGKRPTLPLSPFHFSFFVKIQAIKKRADQSLPFFLNRENYCLTWN
jgi:uncharacterized membrane protein YfbV (UPF0208 family)